jgi:hypothetical protein
MCRFQAGLILCVFCGDSLFVVLQMHSLVRVHFRITTTTLNAELAEPAEPMNLCEFCVLRVVRR